MVLRFCIRKLYGWLKIVTIAFIVCMMISISKVTHDKKCSTKYRSIKNLGLSREQNINERVASTNASIEIKSFGNIGYSSTLKLLYVQSGTLDKSGKYRLYQNIVVGEEYKILSKEYDVTLSSFASPDKLYWIIEVLRTWTGPMSVSVFVVRQELDATTIYINYLRDCYPKIKKQATFHFMSPNERSDEIDAQLIKNSKKKISNIIATNFSCLNRKGHLKNKYLLKCFKLTESKEYIQNFHLPQQHLRNLARKGSRTKYVFLTDIDILPSAGLAKGLSMFLKNSHCYKCAYVIIPYELDSSVKFPSTKNELKQLAAKKHARLYHSKVYPPNQHATNVSMYERTQNDNILHISHESRYEAFWEPFYISQDDITPSHDERFIGYGYTRNSQVMEMAFAGWKFYVLSPAFAIHWDLQNPGYQKKERLLEVAHNYFRFKSFLSEKISAYQNKNWKFPLSYMDKEVKKIRKIVNENEWPRYYIQSNRLKVPIEKVWPQNLIRRNRPSHH